MCRCVRARVCARVCDDVGVWACVRAGDCACGVRACVRACESLNLIMNPGRARVGTRQIAKVEVPF